MKSMSIYFTTVLKILMLSDPIPSRTNFRRDSGIRCIKSEYARNVIPSFSSDEASKRVFGPSLVLIHKPRVVFNSKPVYRRVDRDKAGESTSVDIFTFETHISPCMLFRATEAEHKRSYFITSLFFLV